MRQQELGRTARCFWDFPESFEGNPALVVHSGDDVASIAYGELSRRVDAWRDRLRDLAPVAAPLVALEFETSPEAIAAYLGALRSGFPLLVVEPGQLRGESRLRDLYRPDLILARRDDAFDARRSERIVEASAPHPDLRLLLSTSGTTGDPKLVRLSEGNIASNACAIADYLDLRPSDRAATTLPLFYSYGLSVLNSYLAAGASLALVPESVSSPDFWDHARMMGVTSLAFVPHQIELLDAAGYARMQLPGLRYVTQAGGRLEPAMARRLHAAGRAAGWNLVMMYGQTEAAPRISYVPPDQLPGAADTIGRAIPGGRLHILAEDGTRIEAPGQPGELVYEGPNVMMGYALRREDLAKDREVTELRTGDLAEMTPEGLYRITGRLKRFVKLYGLRLNLDQIEAMLAREGIAAHAVAVSDELVLLHLDPTRGDAVREAVAREYGLPVGRLHAAALSETPLLPSGKTDHKALAAHAARALAQAAQQRPEPVDLAQLFRRATRSREVRPSDSFVSLGGDSLSYLEVQLALEEMLGTLPDRWERMTLAELQALGGAPAPARSTMTLGLDIPLRVAAAALVVMQHASNYPIEGGALVLILLMGFSMGRFQMDLLVKGQAFRFARQLLVPIVPLYFLLLFAYDLLAAHKSTPSLDFFLLGNYYVWHEISVLEPYWFVSLYAQIILATALASLVPGVRQRLAARPWQALALAFWALTVLRIMLEMAGLTFENMGSIGTRGLIECLPLFLVGWMLHAAANPRQLALTALAAGVWLANSAHVLSPDRLWILGSATLVLLWRTDLPVPRGVGRALSRLASVTLWVYLLHVPIITVLWNHPMPEPVRLVIAVLTSFVVAIIAKAISDRVNERLLRPILSAWRSAGDAAGRSQVGPDKMDA